MLFATLSALAAFQAGGSSGVSVSLDHRFKAGEKFAYQVLTHITAEQRFRGLDTWIPSDFDLNYNFSYVVSEVRSEGVAVVRYRRPTMTEVYGETSDSPPREKVDPVDYHEQLTISPVNEILEQKQLDDSAKWLTGPASQNGSTGFFAPYVMEIHRLALFVGSVDEALDFSPKLPLAKVKVGDTWKKTVGYQPQKLPGSSKIAVQRLDYTYTYIGLTSSNGASVLRVEAKLSFSTDVAEYVKQLLGDRADQTNLSKAPVHFDSVVDFDLDPKTRDVLHATGSTSGGYEIFTDASQKAFIEERFKGRASMDLTGHRVALD